MTRSKKANSKIKVIAVWYKQELTLLFREPVAVFFSLAFPLVIYLFIGVPYAEQVLPGTSLKFIDTMFPSLVGTVAANLLLMGLPIYIAELRARQVDKRYRTLPLSGASFATAIILSTLTITVLASLIIIAVVGIVNGLRPEVISPLFILLNLGLVAFLCGVGFFLGMLPFGTRTIQAVTAGVFFIFFFGSGAAAPLDALPKVVQNILEWNPLKIWFDALVAVYTDTSFPKNGVLKIVLTLILSLVLGLVGLISWRRTE